MKQLLRAYSNKLTNLSSANKSLYLPKLYRTDIDLRELSEIPKYSNPFQIIDGLICGKRSFSLGSVVDSRSQSSNKLSARFNQIYKLDQFLLEERGVKDLYVGWPFVHGRFANDIQVRCPLLFFPVSLLRGNNEWSLQQRQDVGISFNKSFLIAYAQFQNAALDNNFVDHVFDDYKDSLTFRTYLYALLKDNQVVLNFNQELFTDALISFKNFTSPQFEETTRTGELKLIPEAMLGLFHQNGSALMADYTTMYQQDKYADLESFFVSKQQVLPVNEDGRTPKIREESMITALPLDASQEAVLKGMKSGRSIVVEGPPGTGKSQLICNVIADYISRGKKVLVVCQKKAALDVVHTRLSQLGLSPFAAMVHDIKYNRAAICAQLNVQIENLDNYKSANATQDALQAERAFLSASRKIEPLLEYLDSFKRALFQADICGVAVKELYLTCSPNDNTIDIETEYQKFQIPALKDFEMKIQKYFGYKTLLQNNPWFNLKFNYQIHTAAAKAEIVIVVEEIFKDFEIWKSDIKKIKSNVPFVSEVKQVYKELDRLIKLRKSGETLQNYNDFRQLLEQPTEKKFFDHHQQRVDACWAVQPPEHTIKTAELAATKMAVDKAVAANKSFIGKLLYNFSKEKKTVQTLMAKHLLAWDQTGLEKLSAKLLNRINLETIYEELKLHGWPCQGNVCDKGFSDGWFASKYVAINAAEIWITVPAAQALIPVQLQTHSEFFSWLSILIKTSCELHNKIIKWLQYFPESSIENLCDKDLNRWLITAYSNQGDDVCGFAFFMSLLTRDEIAILEKLSIRNFDAKEAYQVFDNSIRLAWIKHIEQQLPVLKDATTFILSQAEAHLQTSMIEKSALDIRILKLRLEELTYKGIQHNRLYNRVTYRDLQHQATKRKRIWPLRKLIDSFADEILTLTPCWLASPEVVSSIFPLHQLFDLVIFDEASQCFAEEGIPAMERGKQLMITGDSQQLKPSDLYKVRYDQDTENSDTEVNSLLEITKKYLPAMALREHYRSYAPELIAFSNLHFYNNSLKMLPAQELTNSHQQCLHYRKVDGVWKQNTNEAEAAEVIAIIAAALQKEAQPSLGVVTFNYHQAELISDMLDQWAMQHNQIIPKSIFIKNIENVQGDERDVIVFSLAYGATEDGKVSMHFGSLNQEGGANRLNVAITRARKEIYLVTSVYPHQLNTEAAKHTGPKLLRKYLDYVYYVSQRKPGSNAVATPKESYGMSLAKRILQQTEPASIVHSGFNFSDLMVQEGNFIYGFISTDDDNFHQSLSAKEVHAYQPILAAAKGWKFQRIYSRAYWKDRDALIKTTVGYFLES